MQCVRLSDELQLEFCAKEWAGRSLLSVTLSRRMVTKTPHTPHTLIGRLPHLYHGILFGELLGPGDELLLERVDLEHEVKHVRIGTLELAPAVEVDRPRELIAQGGDFRLLLSLGWRGSAGEGTDLAPTAQACPFI